MLCMLYLALVVLGSIKLASGIYVHLLLLLAALAALLFVRGIQGRLYFPRRLGFWFLAVTLTIVGSLFMNSDADAIRYVAQILFFYLAVFLSCLLVHDHAGLRNVVTGLAVGLSANAIAGFVQSIWWIRSNGFVLISPNGDFFRVTGLCVSPTDYVAQILTGLLLAKTIARASLRRVAIGGYAGLLLISMSRSALLCLVILSIAQVIRYLSHNKRASKYLLALGAAIGLALFAASDSPVVQRFADIANIDYNIKRLVVYQDVVSKIFVDTRHFLFGYGFGTYSFFHPIDEEYYNNPHNLFLYMLYCTGLIGLSAFLMSLKPLVAASYRWWRSTPERAWTASLAASVLLLHVCTWSIALVETNIPGVGTGWVVGSVFGTALMMQRVRRLA